MLKWQRAKGRSQLVHNFCLRGENATALYITEMQFFCVLSG